MNLLLDCGNTRLKWAVSLGNAGVRAQSHIVRRGVCDYASAALAELCGSLHDGSIKALQFSSVVSAEREQALFAQLQPLGLVAQRFTVSDRSGRLLNRYASPQTLGVDRWAAAIGAWGLLGRSCLVISAGTATTIDVVQAEPDGAQAAYRGGLILPGVDLMLRALHTGTARLPHAEDGAYRATPDIADNTQDAIRTGAIDATCGAIERMARVLPTDAPWLLTGGASTHIAAALGRRVTPMVDLVLEGLALDLDDRQIADVSA